MTQTGVGTTGNIDVDMGSENGGVRLVYNMRIH